MEKDESVLKRLRTHIRFDSLLSYSSSLSILFQLTVSCIDLLCVDFVGI